MTRGSAKVEAIGNKLLQQDRLLNFDVVAQAVESYNRRHPSQAWQVAKVKEQPQTFILRRGRRRFIIDQGVPQQAISWMPSEALVNGPAFGITINYQSIGLVNEALAAALQELGLTKQCYPQQGMRCVNLESWGRSTIYYMEEEEAGLLQSLQCTLERDFKQSVMT